MPHPLERILKYLDLTPEQVDTLKSLMVEIRFKRGDKLTTRTQISGSAFYIKHGSARFFYIANGKDNTFSFAFDDQFIIKPQYMMQSTDAVMSIEFLERTDVITIPERTTVETIRGFKGIHDESLSIFFLTAMLEYSHFLEERALLLQTASAIERYRWLTQRYPKVLERATLTQIASYLGMTKETLYRIRAGKYGPKQ